MVKRLLITMTTLFSLLAIAPAVLAENVQVLISTSMGDIELSLDKDKAPVSVANFIKYAKSGYYNGTVFHRVIPGFMAQGGGFTADMEQKKPDAPIKNEADNSLKNTRGTIAMARTSDKDSATSQFFINVADNEFLDHSSRDFGYAVFGKVEKGMDVVDNITKVKTGTKGPYQDVPVTAVMIKSVKVLP